MPLSGACTQEGEILDRIPNSHYENFLIDVSGRDLAPIVLQEIYVIGKYERL
jgi:hypothetical protein